MKLNTFIENVKQDGKAALYWENFEVKNPLKIHINGKPLEEKDFSVSMDGVVNIKVGG